MAEVTKTIENVDRLFSQIVINGEEHESENYVPPVTIAQTPPPQQEQSPSEQQEASPSEETQGEDVYAVELNNVLHDFVDRDVDPLAETVSGLVEDVATIKGEIPPQASSSNQLADKNFVNSSIATNTANFLGTYTSMADIEAIPNPTNNDYVFLQTTDSAGNNVFDRYKYNAEQEEWLFEYELNNSSFTAEQWATINSGLTSSSVSDAINALDVSQAGGSGKFIQAISEANGKISATEGTIDSSVTAGSSNPVSGGAVKTAIDALNFPTLPLSVANGGTGQTTQANINKAVIGALTSGSSDVTDGTEFVSSYASDNGFSDSNAPNVPYKRSFSKVWNYIKGKIGAIFNVSDARYRTDGSTTKIKIKINSTSAWMLCFTVTLYQAYRATKLMISGYQYGSNHWYEPEARLIGDSNGTETISVYFGYDSTNNLWVGFDGGSYTGVSISDVVNGYKDVGNYSGLFTISNVSSLTTLQTTVTASSKANYAVSAGTSASCTGNSATATTATTATSADYSRQGAYCTTASGTANKVADMRGYVYRNGTTFPITFTNSNSSTSALTLNVNGTGAKPIYINGSASSSSNYTIPSGTYICMLDGDVYKIETVWGVPTARRAQNVLGTVAVANGGTGRTTTANGAMYATSATSGLLMGTLPVAQGGTGATSLSSITVGDSDKVDGYHVSTSAITTQNNSLNSLVPVAKHYALDGSSVKGGYIVFSNKLMICWGCHFNSGGNVGQTVNYTTESGGCPSFASATNYIVNATFYNTESGTYYYATNIKSKSTTSFVITSHSDFNANTKFYWMAIGYVS